MALFEETLKSKSRLKTICVHSLLFKVSPMIYFCGCSRIYDYRRGTVTTMYRSSRRYRDGMTLWLSKSVTVC